MKSFKFKLMVWFILIISSFYIFLYAFDNIISPTIITVAESEMKAKASEVMNKTIVKNYVKEFNYEDVINIEKDEEGNVAMIKADTLKMNKIACDVALEAQEELKKLGTIGIKIPMGYIFKNNILAYFGPNITVKMQPIGYIETKYESNFEGAGINQTRHKIYVQVISNMKIIIPLKNTDIKLKSEMPISETIIVGKIPNTAIDLNLDSAGFKIRAGN
ncbi:sporulation protein YunB [Clostridium rectalis]|uniref:sporulation protein YunB n=1 Tax=Clostridium rectalis TaxID=2040295 RepID=UPI00242E08E3|nr:sporulation protein YunB [Clostridium rectalis]